MMTIEEIKDFVANRFKFVDWKIVVEYRDFNVNFILKEEMRDNDKPSRFIDVMTQNSCSIETFQNERILVQFLWRMVTNRLIHEAGELFYVDNVRPFNEHNEETPPELLSKIFGGERLAAVFDERQQVFRHEKLESLTNLK